MNQASGLEPSTHGVGFSSPALRCIGCGGILAEPARDFRCTECGDLLEVVYATPEADSAALKSLWRARKTSLNQADQSGVWRFRELLPILPSAANAVTLREGNTPVYSLPRCARSAGVDTLLAKHQGMNPTGSFKDTGMTAALSVAKAKGFQWVGCASTGNTSASMAAYAARAGMRALVLLPDGKISWGKLAQSLEYGAHTVQLKTDFDGCVNVLLEIIRSYPLYLLNSMNPYRLEGQKTAAFELMEQLDWQVPDHVIVPGGNLANSSALGKGFIEMRALGLIARLPAHLHHPSRGREPAGTQHARIPRRAHRAGESRDARHCHPHRQPRVVEEGRGRAARNRRRVRRGERRRDRRSEE